MNATKLLYNSLSIQQKGILIRFCKTKNKERKAKEPTFKPNIDEQSKKIAQRLRPIGKEMYEHFSEKYNQCVSKIEKLRILQSDKEVCECTFKPRINIKVINDRKRKPLFYY